MPLSVGWIGGMRIIPRRWPLWQFGAVGGGGEDFLESIELSLLLWGDGYAQRFQIVDALLCDGALGVRHLVGFVGVEGSSCGGFGEEVMNISVCTGDRGQGRSKGKKMPFITDIFFFLSSFYCFVRETGIPNLF